MRKATQVLRAPFVALLLVALALPAPATAEVPPVDRPSPTRAVEEALSEPDVSSERLQGLAERIRADRRRDREEALSRAREALVEIPDARTRLAWAIQAQDLIDRRAGELAGMIEEAASAPTRERSEEAVARARRYLASLKSERPVRILRDSNFRGHDLIAPRVLRATTGEGPLTPGAAAGRFALPPDLGFARPGPGDLAPGPGVDLDSEIVKLVENLRRNPALIREFLRNEIEFYPTFGQVQGASKTLLSRKGNAFDIASLGVAMFRAAGIPARFAYGIIEVSPDSFANWMGVDDPMTAVQLAAGGGGIPVTVFYSGERPSRILVEHVWCEAYIPYGPFQGGPHDRVIEADPHWVAVDGAFKQHLVIDEPGLSARLPAFSINGYLASDSALTVSPYDFYRDLAEASVRPVLADTLGPLAYFRIRRPIAQSFGYIPGSEMYRKVEVLSRFSNVTPELQARVVVTIPGSDGVRLALPQIARSSINLDYVPATEEDAKIAANYGGLLATPAYLVNVRPRLLVDGRVAREGVTSSRLGASQKLRLRFELAGNLGGDEIEHTTVAGEIAGLSIQTYKTPAEDMRDLGNAFASVVATDSSLFDTGHARVNAEAARRVLYLLAAHYWFQLESVEESAGDLLRIAYVKQPASMLSTLVIDPTEEFGVVTGAKIAGIGFDVGRNIYAPFQIEGRSGEIPRFMDVVTATSSYFEHNVLEDRLGTVGISTAKGLALAYRNGQQVLSVTDAADPRLAALALPPGLRDRIQSTINLGFQVTIPDRPFSFEGTSGWVYLARDPQTGASQWIISPQGAGAILPRVEDFRFIKDKRFRRFAVFLWGDLEARIFDIPVTAAVTNPSVELLNLFNYAFARDFAIRFSSAGFIATSKPAFNLENIKDKNPFLAAVEWTSNGGIFFFSGHMAPLPGNSIGLDVYGPRSIGGSRTTISREEISSAIPSMTSELQGPRVVIINSCQSGSMSEDVINPIGCCGVTFAPSFGINNDEALIGWKCNVPTFLSLSSIDVALRKWLANQNTTLGDAVSSAPPVPSVCLDIVPIQLDSLQISGTGDITVKEMLEQ